MQSIIQVFKVNDLKKGTSRKTGNPYEIQDAECALITEDGQIDQVGVLMLPKDLYGKVKPGVYMGTFALRTDLERRIVSVLTGLNPIPVQRPAAKAA